MIRWSAESRVPYGLTSLGNLETQTAQRGDGRVGVYAGDGSRDVDHHLQSAKSGLDLQKHRLTRMGAIGRLRTFAD